MTRQGGAPAALQPDDTAARWLALVENDETFYQDSKPTPYVGHAPVMDAGAPGRAGEWLGVRVMHEPSRTFGEVAGRAPSGLWWVALRLGLCDTGPVLVRGDALVVATPELVATIETERARTRALLGPVQPRSGNRKGGRPKGRKPNQPADPTVRRCNDCGRVFPLEEFRFKNKAANQRSYLCRACDNRRKREARAAASLDRCFTRNERLYRERTAVEMQACRGCGQMLPLDEFPVNGSRVNGREYLCRTCYNARMRTYRASKQTRAGLAQGGNGD